MAFKYLAALLLSGTAMAQLRTTDFQQSLNASAPRNYIVNSGAEKNDLNVTDAGGIVSRTTTTPLEGVGSFVIDAASSTQKAIFIASDLQDGLLGQSCEATANYVGDGSLYKAYVTLAGTTVSTEVTLLNSGTSSQAISVIFPCGSSTTADPAFVIEATGNGASIEVDSVYLGKALNIGSAAQSSPRLFAQRSSSQSITVTTPVVVVYNQTTSPGYDNFSELNTSTGVVTLKTSGVVQVNASVNVTNGAVELFGLAVRKNGAAVCSVLATVSSATGQTLVTPCAFSVAVGDTIDVTIDSTSDASYNADNSSGTFLQVSVNPSTSQVVVRGDVTDLSGFSKSPLTASCLWSTTSASMAAFSVAAACPAMTTSGNIQTPATKVPGFIVPTLFPGKYEITAQALFLADNSTSGSQTCAYELHDGTSSGGVGSLTQIVNQGRDGAMTLVGQFEYASIQSNKSFQIRGQRVSGNASCILAADVADLTFTIKPISQGLPKPFIPSSVFAGRSSVVKVGIAALTCATSSTIDSNPDSMISAIGNRSSATCTITFNGGFFSSTPRCVVSGEGASATYASSAITSSTAGSIFTYSSAATGADRSVNLFCIGN